MTFACYDKRHEPVPVNPDRLQGPLVGQFALYYDQVVRVIERSYVWAPEQHHEGGPLDGYHGTRRYDWSVIERGPDGYRTVVVNDTDLTPLAEEDQGKVRTVYTVPPYVMSRARIVNDVEKFVGR